MATERFTNNATTTLSADVSTTIQTSVDVDSDADFPSSPQFRIKMGDEVMLVTAVNGGNNWTVTREMEGTVASTYSTGVDVVHLLTAASLGNAVRGDLAYGVDSGAANAYVVVLEIVPEDYQTGMIVQIDPVNNNTGASTINVNSLGVKTIKKNVTDDLDEGDIVASKIFSIIYDGTNFQLLTFPEIILNITPTGTLDGTNDTFTMPDTYIISTTKVFRNGLRQKLGDDYSESVPDIVFTTPPNSGDLLLTDYKK